MPLLIPETLMGELTPLVLLSGMPIGVLLFNNAGLRLTNPLLKRRRFVTGPKLLLTTSVNWTGVPHTKSGAVITWNPLRLVKNPFTGTDGRVMVGWPMVTPGVPVKGFFT